LLGRYKRLLIENMVSGSKKGRMVKGARGKLVKRRNVAKVGNGVRDSVAVLPGSRENMLRRRPPLIALEAEVDEDGMPEARRFKINGKPKSVSSQDTMSTMDASRNKKSEENANEKWAKARSYGTNEIGKIIEIQKFIRLGLFPKLKFFVNKEQMNWSEEGNSMAQFVVRGLNVAPNMEGCRNWWHDNSDMILKEVNRKRNDVISQVQQKFKGKLF